MMEELFSVITILATISSVVGFIISAKINSKKNMVSLQESKALQCIEKNEFLSQASNSLLESIKGQDQAVIQVGSMLIVKNETRIITLSLDPDQVLYLEAHRYLFNKPNELIEKIQDIGNKTKYITPAKIVNLS